MEGADPSSRFLDQPTEGTPLLFGDSDRASQRARALDPDEEPWRTDAHDDAAPPPGAAATRLPHSREFLVGLFFSLATAALSLVFSFTIMIMGITSPSDFHIQWGMRIALQGISVLAFIALATGTYNLLLGSERNKPALFAVNLLVDLVVGFYVVALAAEEISDFPSIASCYLANQPTSPQCAGFLNKFLIVGGIYLAISLALGITHLAFFLFRLVQLILSTRSWPLWGNIAAYLRRASASGGVLSSVRLSLGSLVFEASLHLIGQRSQSDNEQTAAGPSEEQTAPPLGA